MGRRAIVAAAATTLAFFAACAPEPEPPAPVETEPAPTVEQPRTDVPTVVTSNYLGDLRRTASYSVSGFSRPPVVYGRTALPGAVIASSVAHEGNVLAATVSGQLLSIHAGTGVIGWSYEVGESVAATPVAAADSAYVLDVGGTVHAVDAATGRQRWTRSLGAIVSAAPGITRSRLFVLSSEALVLIDRESGEIETTVPISDGQSFAVARGIAFVARRDGSIVAVDTADGGRHWTAAGPERLRAGPVVIDGAVFVGFAGGIIHRLDGETGEVAAEATLGSGATPVGIAAGTQIYVADVRGSVYALSPEDLTELWSYEGTIGYSGPPSVVDGLVYLATDLGEVLALSPDGRVVFSDDVGAGLVGGLLPVQDGLIALGERGELILLGPGGEVAAQPESREETGDFVGLRVDEAVTRPVPSSQDLYIFSPPQDGTYQLVLPDQESVEMVVDLYDSDGVELQSNLDKVSLAPTLTVRLEGEARYIIEAYPVRDGLAGRTYTIQVTLLR